MKLLPWERKAHRIIGNLCQQSYKESNTSKSGKPYKKHRPYSVPKLAEDLVKALRNDDEETAKALFLTYDGMKAI